MHYEIGRIKLDELAGYFRDKKINLIPPFQRGRVWTKSLRKKFTLAQILKAFLGSDENTKITATEKSKLSRLFEFLKEFYSRKGIKESKLATDQPHFYTMATSIHSLDLIDKYGKALLIGRLVKVAGFISGTQKPPKNFAKIFREYMDLSAKQTTHPGRRSSRQEKFAQLVEAAQ